MLNIYLKVTIEKTDVLKLRFSKFKKIRLRVSFLGAPTHVDIIEF